MRDYQNTHVPHRMAYVCHHGHIEQWRTHRIGEQDAWTHEHPQYADLCQSGGTQVERGYG